MTKRSIPKKVEFLNEEPELVINGETGHMLFDLATEAEHYVLVDGPFSNGRIYSLLLGKYTKIYEIYDHTPPNLISNTVLIPTKDGLAYPARYYEPKHPKGTVIYVHGGVWNKRMTPSFRQKGEKSIIPLLMGYRFLAISYRGNLTAK